MSEKQEWSSEAFKALNLMRSEEELCDVLLVVEKKEFPAHRAVLASRVPYFKAMFRSKMKETQKKRVVLQDIESDSLECILDYVYTNEIVIDDDNVNQILSASDILLLSEIKKTCLDFLMRNVNIQNCVHIMLYADLYNSSVNLLEIENFMINHFSEIADSPSNELMLLTYDYFMKLICRDDIEASQQKILETVMLWINHDATSRKNYLPNLLQAVQLDKISAATLIKTMKEESLIRKRDQCHQLFCDAIEKKMHSLSVGDNYSGESLSTETLDKTDATLCSSSDGKVIVVLGATATFYAPLTIEFYDIEKKVWNKISKPQETDLRDFVANSDGHKFCVVPWLSSKSNEEGVLCYDPFSHKLTRIIKPKVYGQTDDPLYMYRVYKHRCFALGLLNLHFFVINLDDKKPQWTSLQNIPSDTYIDMFNFEIDEKGNIFLIEFFLAQSTVVFTYDFSLNIWKKVCNVNTEGFSYSMVIMNQNVYLPGFQVTGNVFYNCNIDRCKRCIRYDLKKKKCSFIADLSKTRMESSIVAVDGLLYAIGGGGEAGINYSSTDVYSPKTNTWTLLPAEMNECRRKPGVVVLNKSELFKNITENC